MRLAKRICLLLVAAPVVMSGCGLFFTEIDDHPCPTGGTTLTYENFGQAFMAEHCQQRGSSSGARTRMTLCRRGRRIRRWRRGKNSRSGWRAGRLETMWTSVGQVGGRWRSMCRAVGEVEGTSGGGVNMGCRGGGYLRGR